MRRQLQLQHPQSIGALYHRDGGFTIIEIVIAIGIILLLLGISYSGYANFSERQKLISAGQNLKNILRDVQSRDYNNEVDCNVCDCNNPNVNSLEGWYIDFGNRLFFGRCQGKNFGADDLTIPAEIDIETSNPVIEFLSSPPRISKDTIVCLVSAGLPNRFYRIDISQSGDISDSGGLIDSCDLSG